MAVQYHYKPLHGNDDFTRLIVLEPSISSEAPLLCSLHTVKETINYDAVSYAWEGQTPCSAHRLFIDRFNQYLEITANVEKILRALRHPTLRRHIWIDAVCINQKDTNEKNIQVRQMSKIYSRAAKVVIWLNLSTEIGDAVAYFLKSVFGKSLAYTKPSIDHMDTSILTVIFGQPWFQRRWIIQEVALGGETLMVCGSTHINFDVFCVTLDAVTEKYGMVVSAPSGTIAALKSINSTRVNLRNLDSIMACYFDKSSRSQIFEWMNAYHQFDCFDSRDRIIALLGIAQKATQLIMDVDSDSALQSFISSLVDYDESVQSLYIRFAQAALTDHSDPFKLLQCAGAFNGNDRLVNPFPTWVPDWRHPRAYNPIFCISALENIFLPNGLGVKHRREPESPLPSFDHHKMSITFYGQKISIIQRMGSTPASEDIIISEPKPFFMSWLSVLTSERRHGPGSRWLFGGTLVQRLANLITAHPPKDRSNFIPKNPLGDRWDERSEKSALRKLLQHWLSEACLKSLTVNTSRATLDSIKPQAEFVVTTQDQILIRKALPTIKRVSQVMAGRTVFTTTDGHIGMCPGKTKHGDILVILWGANTPFILRPTSTAAPAVQDCEEISVSLVGECYVDGIMKGEKIRSLEKESRFVIV